MSSGTGYGPIPMADILIVGDNEDIRLQIRGILETLGHEVHFVGSQDGALRLYFGQSIDVVVTDVSRPRWSGIELIAALKASNPSVRVIAVSGKGGGGLSAARAAGADATLTKPVASRDVVKAVLDALGAEDSAPCPHCGTPGRRTRTFQGLLCHACGVMKPDPSDVGVLEGGGGVTGAWEVVTYKPFAVKCPSCGRKANAFGRDRQCLLLCQCPYCGSPIRPEEGHCCVFCSYGEPSSLPDLPALRRAVWGVSAEPCPLPELVACPCPAR